MFCIVSISNQARRAVVSRFARVIGREASTLGERAFSGLAKTFCANWAARVIRMPRLTQLADSFHQSESREEKNIQTLRFYVFVGAFRARATRLRSTYGALTFFFYLASPLPPNRDKHRCFETAEAGVKHLHALSLDT